MPVNPEDRTAFGVIAHRAGRSTGPPPRPEFARSDAEKVEQSKQSGVHRVGWTDHGSRGAFTPGPTVERVREQMVRLEATDRAERGW